MVQKNAIELLTGCSIVNAWVLFNKYHCGGNKLRILKFRESIVLSLLTGSSEEVLRPGRRVTSVGPGPVLHTSEGQHCLTEVEGPKSKTRKRCRDCYDMISRNEGSRAATKMAKKVSTYCKHCEDKPFLCLSCFETRHLST